jgi:hypothetical protein
MNFEVREKQIIGGRWDGLLCVIPEPMNQVGWLVMNTWSLDHMAGNLNPEVGAQKFEIKGCELHPIEK